MRLLPCLVLGALSVTACSSSSSTSSPPSSKTVYLPLHLTSAKDSDGKDYAAQFQDLPASHLYLKLIVTTYSDGAISTEPTLLDVSNRDLGASIDEAHPEVMSIGTPPLIEGRDFRIDPFADDYELTEMTSLSSKAGSVATLTVGGVLTGTAQARVDDIAAGDAMRTVTVTYTAEAQSPVTYAVTGPSFGGNTYLPLLPVRVGGSQPVTYSDPVTMSIDGKPAFTFDEHLFGEGSVSGGGVWLYGGDGQASGDVYDDGLRRTVFFPAATAWDGTPVAATQLDVAPVSLSAQTSIDFSVPADASAPYVALRGNAKVTADPLCEKGTCLVIEETADSASTLCTDSAVGSVAGFWPQSDKEFVFRMRILGHDAKDSQRVHLGRPGFLFEAGNLQPTSTVADFTYDSGWMDAPSIGPFGAAVAAYVVDCAPGVRVMFQSVTQLP